MADIYSIFIRVEARLIEKQAKDNTQEKTPLDYICIQYQKYIGENGKRFINKISTEKAQRKAKKQKIAGEKQKAKQAMIAERKK